MQATTTIKIRFADCDPMGHTNNAKYFTYMEQSRVALFKQIFHIPAKAALKPEQFPFILAEISCKFLKPTYVEDGLLVSAKVVEVGNKSFMINYEMQDEGTFDLIATGRSAQVWYDYKTGKSLAIPEDMKKLLNT